MDIGTSAYTEFKESVDVISYRAENDLLGDDIFEGLIHSHNTMATFFSGTDCSTLSEEGTNSNHFVSLIVNNAGSYTAAVTRRVVTESTIDSIIRTTSNKYYDTYNGERVYLSEDDVKEETKSETKTTSFIEYFDLKITKEEAQYQFQDIDSRLAEIKRNKSKFVSNSKGSQSTIGKSPTTHYPSYPSYGSYGSNGSSGSSRSYYNGYPYSSVFDSDDVSDLDDYDPYDVRGHIVSSASGGGGTSFQTKEEEEEKEEKKKVSTTEIPLCLQESFDKEIIERISLQLLTGSIIINSEAVAAKDWVKKMDNIYEKRFGYLDKEAHPSANEEVILENNVRLEEWIQAIVEFLVYTRDEDLISRLNIIGEVDDIEYDESDTAEVCAYDMYHYLETLPDSYVKDKMLQILDGYIPNGLENY